MRTTTVSRPVLQAALQQRLDAALQGQESIYIVCGDAGSGKTQLIQQFAQQAQADRDDLLVAYSACNAITGISDAYMPFREILQYLSGDVDESLAEGNANIGNVSRLTRFMQTSARALIENGPDLVDVFVPGGALLTRLSGRVAQRWAWFEKLTAQVSEKQFQHASAEISQDNIFEQYTRVIEAISAEAPLLLIIDDLHWSDKASLGLIFQLARRLVNNRVLIIAATRPPNESAESSELRNLIGELQRYFGDVELDLSAQPENEFIDEYLDAIGMQSLDDARDALAKQTGGNPLFVVELLRQIAFENQEHNVLSEMDVRKIPAKLSGVFQRLLQSLNDEDRQILATASVQGNEFWAELLADIHAESALSVVRRLGDHLHREQHIVVDAGVAELPTGTVSRFRFRHDLMREYVYQTLTENERRLLHQSVASVIEQRLSGETEAYALELADHFEKAQDWQKALRYRVISATRIERACAPTEAARHYQTAVDLCEKQRTHPSGDLFDLRRRLASQLALAGDYEQAEEVARAALDSADTALDASLAWLAIGRVLAKRRDHATALDALSKAESILPADENDELVEQQRIDILLERAVVNYFNRNHEALRSTNKLLAKLVEAHGNPRQRTAFYSSQSRQALVEHNYSPQGDADLYARKAIDCMQPSSASSIFGLGFATLWKERIAEAINILEDARSQAARHGDSITQLQALTYLSVAHRRTGDVDNAEDYAEQLGQLLEHVKISEYPSVLAAQRSWVAYRRGNANVAVKLATSATRDWNERKSAYPFCWIGNWVLFAVSAPSSAAAASAAHHMLLPQQAWLSTKVVEALETYLCSDKSNSAYDATVRAAQEAGYL